MTRWKRLGSRPAGDFRIFRLRQDLYRHARFPAPREFVVMESADWVNIVPVTDDGDVVFVRQYRHGIARHTLEVPGGLVDPEDGRPEVAARREMREETGYECRALASLGSVHPNPAVQDNACHSYLAEGAVRVDEPTPDPSEDIEVERRPLAEVPELIRSGVITHALVVVAFYRLDQWLRAERDRGLADGWG